VLFSVAVGVSGALARMSGGFAASARQIETEHSWLSVANLGVKTEDGYFFLLFRAACSPWMVAAFERRGLFAKKENIGASARLRRVSRSLASGISSTGMIPAMPLAVASRLTRSYRPRQYRSLPIATVVADPAAIKHVLEGESLAQ